MALEILSDPRLKKVEWHDLMELSRWEVIWELTIGLPWLFASWWFAQQHLWILALPCSFMFFLCGLRQVHNAFHLAIGIPKKAHDWVQFILSPLMMSCMHAVEFNHLRHHAHCMDEEDVEAYSAMMPGWKALLQGPKFPILLHKTALQKGRARTRNWIYAEFAAIVAFVAFGIWVNSTWLNYHLIAMAVGQSFSAFFAVWTVHHDCDRTHYIARTIRSPLKSLITYDMFYHVEHHLFPTVPTCKLPTLAKRLDEVAPELQAKQVF